MEPEEHIILDDEPQAQHDQHIHPVETQHEYIKFAAVLFAILLVSVGVTTLRGWGGNRFANDFMAVFFVTFAAFKFINIEMFAITYRTYDILAKKIRPWAYAFPFIEAFLGLAYFISTDAWQLNVITMLITGTAGYGVWKELRRKSNFTCACLGPFIRLPLSKVSFVEDAAMFVMATIMLIG
ncbi:hypothetical protein H0X10_01885 [Candidatus Saccharibacteria bacterium]|nr:hypothetical protein [Candidatus Saccharibacteria bacterium]